MSDQYPKYQLPSGNWITDKDHADELWLAHNSGRRGPGCQVAGYCPDHPLHPQPSPPYTASEPSLVFECCEELPYPEPGQEVRCGGCGTVFVLALPDGWREWASPENVTHAVPPTGPCATCGKGRHDNDQETAS